MSPEVALLHELWDRIKGFIPQKERLRIAEEVVRIFDDNVDISEFDEVINEFDSVMKAAIISHFDIGFDDNDDDDDDWDY